MDWKLGYGVLGLIALILCGGFFWYEWMEAPEVIPTSIIFTQPAVLDPYPELAGLRISINTASLKDLQKLPGIGPVKAKAIQDYIRDYGKIIRAPQLLEVDGIGEDLLDRIEPYIKFD